MNAIILPMPNSRIRIFTSVFRTRSNKLYLENKESTRTMVNDRLKHFNTHYNLPVGRIAIRNQKSRWGSCSKKGNLNFNYKLAFLSPELRDYVIVHELCHVREFNHSKGFWELVGETMPHWKKLRRELKNVK